MPVRDAMRDDIRHSLRVLRRHPAYVALLAAVFAVGVAGPATMFRLVDDTLLRPPGGVADVEHIDRLAVERTFPGAGLQRSAYVSYPLFAFLREQLTTFDHIAALADAPLSLGRGTAAEEVRAQLATGDYFAVVGAQPFVGRFFTASDDRPPYGTPVVVLSYDYWQRRFGGRRDVVGSGLVLGDWTYTVIGIARPRFHGVDYGAVDMWVPLSTAAASSVLSDWDTNQGSLWLRVVSHRPEGTSRQFAEQRASAAYRQYLTQRSASRSQARVVLAPVLGPTDPRAAKNGRFATLLSVVALLLFVVSLANVAILQLAHVSSRGRELATRRALGGNRGQIGRQLLMELLGPAALGLLAGALLTALAVRPLQQRLFDTLVWSGSALDARTWAVVGALTVALALVGVGASLAQTRRSDATAELRSAGLGMRRLPRRTRSTLITVQVSLAMILLVVAGLFALSLHRALTVDLGFDPAGVFVVQLTGLDVAGPDANRFPPQRVRTLYRQVYDRSRALPAVSGAALSLSVPFSAIYGSDIKVPGHEPLPAIATGGPYVNAVTTTYFGAMHARFVEGRSFSTDSSSAQHELVVNETLARAVWGSPKQSLGACVEVTDESGCRSVVGVIHDVKQMSLNEAPVMQFFVPLAGSGWTPRNVLLRLRADQPGGIGAIRSAVQGVAADLPFARITSLSSFLEPQLEPLEVAKLAVSMAAGLALAVAGTGLYSVLAFAVSVRRREVGIRLALGATRSRAALGVLRDGLVALLAGLVVGLAIILFSQNLLSRFLFDTSPADTGVLGAAALILCTIALVAGAMPAVRAAHVDPAVVLREE